MGISRIKGKGQDNMYIYLNKLLQFIYVTIILQVFAISEHLHFLIFQLFNVLVIKHFHLFITQYYILDWFGMSCIYMIIDQI